MPRRPRTTLRRTPRQKRGEDTIDVLLRATEIELGRHGFHGTSTNRIAEVAGVSVGTLYHYFPTKEALVEALVHRLWAREIAAIEAAEASVAEVPIQVATRVLVDAFVTGMARQRALYAAWYGDARHLGRQDLGQELIGRAVEIAHRALERTRDDVRPQDARFAAELVVRAGAAVVRMAADKWPTETETGVLSRELTEMLSRYLMRAPPA